MKGISYCVMRRKATAVRSCYGKFHRSASGGVGHGSRDSIRPIKCRFSRGNGGHIFRRELRIGCRFSITNNDARLILR